MPESSFVANSSGANCTTSWSVGDIVELLHDTFPATVVGTSCALGHVIGTDRSEAGVQGVRVRQLLTASQVPAVLCFVSVVHVELPCLVCLFIAASKYLSR